MTVLSHTKTHHFLHKDSSSCSEAISPSFVSSEGKQQHLCFARKFGMTETTAANPSPPPTFRDFE